MMRIQLKRKDACFIKRIGSYMLLHINDLSRNQSYARCDQRNVWGAASPAKFNLHRISIRLPRENFPEGTKALGLYTLKLYIQRAINYSFSRIYGCTSHINKVRRFLNRGRVYIIKKDLMHVPSTGGSSTQRLILELGNKKNRMWQRCLVAYEALWGAKIASYL